MSITLENTLASIPQIERGYGYIMNADGKKGDRLLYCNKKSVFIRSLADTTKSGIFAGEHKGNCKVAVSSPNGEYIASGDDQGRMLIWGQGNQMIKSDFPINKCINDIAWDSDGKRLICAGNGSDALAKAVAWDTGSALGSVGGNLKTLLSCDYRKERPFRVVTGGEDMKVGIYEGPPFKQMGEFRTEHSNYINKIRYAPDGLNFATCSSDKSIKIYEGKEGTLIKSMESKDGHAASIYSFSWSPCSKKILSCGADKKACVWNVESGEVETSWTLGTTVDDMQMSALWYKDNIITVSLSGAMNFLDPADNTKPKKIIVGHNSDVAGIAMDVANRVFYSADANGKVCKWKDGEASWFSGGGHKKSIRGLALNHNKTKLCTVGLDDKLRVSDCKSMELDSNGVALGGVPYAVACGTKTDVVVVSTSNKELVTVKGSTTKKAKLPDIALTMEFSPDETQLAVGFKSGGAKVYSWNDGEIKVQHEYAQTTKAINRVTWSPNGKQVIITGDDKMILVFEGDKQLNKSDWEFHAGIVRDVVFSPSGKSVTSVGADLTIINFKDTETWGTTRAKIDMAHREGITAVGYLDENTIVTVGADMCMKIWKLA